MRYLGKKNFIRSCITSILMSTTFITPFVSATIFASSAQAAVIQSVSVQGNQLIPSNTIRDFAGIRFGEDMSSAEINAVLRRLYDSGMFEDVDLRISGSTLIITVVENPSVSVVAFEGNRDIKDEVLAAIVDSSARSPFSRTTAEADARRIAAAYSEKGRLNASVRPVIIPVSDGRVNLVFEITESPVAGVDQVSFIGNNDYSDRRLRGIVDTNETNFLSYILGRSTIDPATIAKDRQELEDFYKNKGYFDFQILSSVPTLSSDQSSYNLVYTINEGFKYNFGQATISSSINGVDAAAFEEYVRIRAGRVYKSDDVKDVVEDIEAEAVRRGLPFLRVNPQFTKNDADRTVAVNFNLVNGRRIYVERIDIGGNTVTRERVIRRQFDFVEGDAFNARKLSEAADKLRALGIFGNANVTIREGSSPDKAIVDVEVEEKPTGSIGFGAGYSSDSGFNGSLNLSDRNFLGRGQNFSLDLSIAEDSNSFSFSFAEPSLFGRDLYAGVNVYYRDVTRSESSYQTTNIGFEPSIGFALGRNTNLRLTYRLSQDEIRVEDDVASPIVNLDEGTFLTSALSARLTYDRRNSAIEPTSGYILTLEEEFAGIGGDINYSKTIARGKIYGSLFDESVILSAEVEGGALISTGGNGSRITDRFFLGGQSLRGFAVGGIGPRDTIGTNNDALGGNMYSVVRLKSSFPLGFPDDYGIYGGAFIEAGSVWGLDNIAGVDDSFSIRASSGVSLFWTTPIGPLEFSYAIPFLKEDTDETKNFSVSISTRF